MKKSHCDASSHTAAILYAGVAPRDEFVQKPAKTTINLHVWWSCTTTLWYFLEDDEKDLSKGTTGFAYQVNPKLDETDWNVIRQWVDGCLQRHQSGCICREPFDLPGFQVIDCKARKLVAWDKKAEFAALSYVWGASQCEAGRTSDCSQTQVDRTTLPNPAERVVEDALACTSKLKIPYLWVDRYCINQEDESETKQRLIQSMDKIYSAAKVTIINAAGNDASAGLPGVSETLRLSTLRRAMIGGHKLIPMFNPNDEIGESKWASRGWTLQEGLMARRRLVFTDTRVYFQCTQSHYIEGFFGELHPFKHDFQHNLRPGEESQALPNSVVAFDSRFSIADVCNKFTSRDLTEDKDALDACLGIFSRFWRRNEPVYQYYGLPFQENSDAAFASSLLWRSDLHQYTYRWLEGSQKPFRRAWGPSWSWLSWRGHMGFSRTTGFGRTMGFRRVNWRDEDRKVRLWVTIKLPQRQEEKIVLSTIDGYVESIDRDGIYQHWLPYLELSGWMATMRFEHVRGRPDDKFDGDVSCYFALEGNDQDHPRYGSGVILPPMWATYLENDEAFNFSRLLNVMVIAEDGIYLRCLVIHPVGKEKTDRYERLGFCEIYGDCSGIKHDQDKTYIIAKDTQFGERRDLECKLKTITLT